MQPTLGQPLFLAYHNGTYTLTETDPDRFIRTEWTQLMPLPTNDLRTLSLTLINASGEQRPLFTFENPAAYLTLPVLSRYNNDQSELGKGCTAMLRKLNYFLTSLSVHA